MPHHFEYGSPPCGVSLHSVKDGEQAEIVTREFLSSEDGMKLILRLESLFTDRLEKLLSGSDCGISQIDHLLLHFDRTGSATLYVNELSKIGYVGIKNDMQAGNPILKDEIVDVNEFRFEGVEVPAEHGVAVVLSHGWRKCLYFDFEPIRVRDGRRNYDLWAVLGQCYNYLLFQEFLSIGDDVLEKMFAAKWFPFIGLSTRTINELIGWIKSQRSADEILMNAKKDVVARLPAMRKRWSSSSIFWGHEEMLNKAVERFEASDWISANSILYPRIEGILRDVAKSSSSRSFSQSTLANAPSVSAKLPATSRLFPHKFREYLETIYFKEFHPNKPASMSRHSAAHGVAPASEYSEKAAVLALLIVDQIMFHIPGAQQSL